MNFWMSLSLVRRRCRTSSRSSSMPAAIRSAPKKGPLGARVTSILRSGRYTGRRSASSPGARPSAAADAVHRVVASADPLRFGRAQRPNAERTRRATATAAKRGQRGCAGSRSIARNVAQTVAVATRKACSCALRPARARAAKFVRSAHGEGSHLSGTLRAAVASFPCRVAEWRRRRRRAGACARVCARDRERRFDFAAQAPSTRALARGGSETDSGNLMTACHVAYCMLALQLAQCDTEVPTSSLQPVKSRVNACVQRS